MRGDAPGTASAYHSGEREVQARAGVLAEADRLARGVSPTIPAGLEGMMAGHRLAVAASLDEGGGVWASLLTGPPGFLHRVDEDLLLIESQPAPLDPLRRNLATRPELGLLAIDLEKRRRLRINGRAFHDPARGIFVAVEQVYGNCPKYIQARRVEPVAGEMSPQPTPPDSSWVLHAEQQALIASADTFFIASFHGPGGADASHRGGAPGFVRILDEHTLAFGDYPGNNMFNTLGNLVVQPRAGLLFLDFTSGDVLQISGEAHLDRAPASLASFRGARGVVVVFEVERALVTRGAGVRGRLLEPSPVNP